MELYLNPDQSNGAAIDPNRKYSNVTLVSSDHPHGLVQFSLSSRSVAMFASFALSSIFCSVTCDLFVVCLELLLRMVFLEQSSTQVLLRIERIGHTGKETLVTFNTQQLAGPEVIAGVRVYHALEGADYVSTNGALLFRPGEVKISCKYLYS